jgi:hypothetical protein
MEKVAGLKRTEVTIQLEAEVSERTIQALLIALDLMKPVRQVTAIRWNGFKEEL